jgi:hypothetical protein
MASERDDPSRAANLEALDQEEERSDRHATERRVLPITQSLPSANNSSRPDHPLPDRSLVLPATHSTSTVLLLTSEPVDRSTELPATQAIAVPEARLQRHTTAPTSSRPPTAAVALGSGTAVTLIVPSINVGTKSGPCVK